jgi:hypothetical protein
MEERMLKLFAYGHLERGDLQAVSMSFAALAEAIVRTVPVARSAPLLHVGWRKSQTRCAASDRRICSGQSRAG